MKIKRKNRKISKKIITFLILFLIIIPISFFLGKIKPFLPNISLNQEKNNIIRPYEKINSVLDLEKQLQDKKIEYEYVKLSSNDGTYIAQIKQGPRVFFSQGKDINNQVYSLQTILTRLTIENKKPSLIDLRFDKPIVKF